MKGIYMKLYIVIKKGIYIQDIIGVFDDLEKAKTSALEKVSEEPDDHHSFHIAETELNKSKDNDTYLSETVIFDIEREGLNIITQQGAQLERRIKRPPPS